MDIAPPSEDTPASKNELSAAQSSCEPCEQDGHDTQYPTGMKLGLIVLALCLSILTVAVDDTIITTAIPKITSQFNSLDDVGWYGSAYLLTTSSLQLLFGKIYTLFDIKLVFLSSVAIFELGSLICGVANSSLTLIVGRAVAGIGAAAIFSGALIILASSVPLPRRPFYIGCVGSMYGIAVVAGPLLGGLLTDKLSWRWCFFINLPIGGVTFLVILKFFQAPPREIEKRSYSERLKSFDFPGVSVFMSAVICLLLALQWGGSTYSWSNWRVLLLLCMFGVLFIVFLIIQYRQGESAIVPPRIISDRTVCLCCLFNFCLGSSFIGSIYFLPIWFQAVKGVSAVQSGLMNLPLLISVVIFCAITGGLVSLIGYYTPFLFLSAALLGIGYGLMTTFQLNSPPSIWIGYQVIAGIGIGFGMQQPVTAVQAALESRDVPVGTVLVTFMETIGGSIFVLADENIFRKELVKNLHEYIPSLDPNVILSTGASSIRAVVDSADLAPVLFSYNNAITSTFVVCSLLSIPAFLGALMMKWKNIKGKNANHLEAS
ncbi:hypothetical protein P175DRAFT_0503065 [Aspergillus ochraceoroseus IBT 24754]|uniref:Major facilitator superfamily (MFS) profile domain-containing protein n=3 Tax=Aspergillus subgen. Nidulantes TaxID=2720870 RepID=A0A0F8URD8_9EURO|nr:uncharacterized protein P175DRAFT_0503065 [Aspergillus ochraceoroseus IBT 24754]KKK22058.1 hypothetical protein ARAM_002404 [Aspergillus rambellii]KKK26007.1 hypothetical protein AOCH_000457 [Aspergillus ochraceoroseus]PTU19529.1 hypothetical protein P175DRAFT_0503065 [Aspergillus ochraceoroseus IBT 24754]